LLFPLSSLLQLFRPDGYGDFRHTEALQAFFRRFASSFVPVSNGIILRQHLPHVGYMAFLPAIGNRPYGQFRQYIVFGGDAQLAGQCALQLESAFPGLRSSTVVFQPVAALTMPIIKLNGIWAK